ncbi:MAG: PEP-utilizing enzyme [Chloroflexota bacterium]|nr:PEP-utilizing enzyme [Chloroflexota bacterium]
MVSSFKEDFSVAWENPSDGQMPWLFDAMHTPAPLCPLAAEFWDRLMSAYMGMRTVFVNGYAYSSPPTPRPPSPEILVCATTAPPWILLFAIAAAVVTDSGGVLPHSAICAREYAIPCVVATQVATQVSGTDLRSRSMGRRASW